MRFPTDVLCADERYGERLIPPSGTRCDRQGVLPGSALEGMTFTSAAMRSPP